MTTLILAAATLVSLEIGLAQERASAQQLFEAGRYREALQAIAGQREAGTAGAAEGYLAVQIFLKLDQHDNAKSELSRFTDHAEPVWKAIGESARALTVKDENGALKAAERAVAMAPNHFFAHYQLGLVRAGRADWAGAAAAFERAAEIDPLFAYAHYYAGFSYSRVKQVDRMAVHFERFLKLAPKAPERPAVESIMRTLRGR